MTPEQARWVYDVVIPLRYKESVGAVMWTGARENRRDGGQGMAFLAMCACQYGLCGRCGDGHPERCSHANWEPGVHADTGIIAVSGASVAQVWRKGRPCYWLCPTVRVGQLSLFAGPK